MVQKILQHFGKCAVNSVKLQLRNGLEQTQ